MPELTESRGAGQSQASIRGCSAVQSAQIANFFTLADSRRLITFLNGNLRCVVSDIIRAEEESSIL